MSVKLGDRCPSCGGKCVDEGTGEWVICDRCGDEWERDEDDEDGCPRCGSKNVTCDLWERHTHICRNCGHHADLEAVSEAVFANPESAGLTE